MLTVSNSKIITNKLISEEFLCGDKCSDLGLLEFIASVVDSLAWPILILVLAIIFRKSFSELLGKLKKVDWGNRVAEFEQELSKIEQEVDELSGESELFLEEVPELVEVVSHSEDLADNYPPLAVIQSWIAIEKELRSVAERIGFLESERISIGSILRQFRKRDIFPPSTLSLIDEMRVMRNKAAHGDLNEITREQALRFYEVANEIRRYIRSMDIDNSPVG